MVATGYRNWARRGTGIGRDGVPDLVQCCQHIWYRFRTIFGAGLGLGGRNLWTSQDFGPWLVPDNTEHQRLAAALVLDLAPGRPDRLQRGRSRSAVRRRNHDMQAMAEAKASVCVNLSGCPTRTAHNNSKKARPRIPETPARPTGAEEGDEAREERGIRGWVAFWVAFLLEKLLPRRIFCPRVVFKETWDAAQKWLEGRASVFKKRLINENVNFGRALIKLNPLPPPPSAPSTTFHPMRSIALGGTLWKGRRGWDWGWCSVLAGTN